MLLRNKFVSQQTGGDNGFMCCPQTEQHKPQKEPLPMQLMTLLWDFPQIPPQLWYSWLAYTAINYTMLAQ